MSAKRLTASLLVCGASCTASQSFGLSTDTTIPDRATLVAELGVAAQTEDFENWSDPLDYTPQSDFQTLDSTTVVGGSGPGIVNAGLTFSNLNTNRDFDELQLDRRSQFQLASGVLVGEGGTLVIDFQSAVTHAGFDMTQFDGFPDTGFVEVLAADDSTVLFTSPTLAIAGAPGSTFFGYQSTSGIGMVRVNATFNGWSPLVDNLTYGVVPEPASLTLIGGGLVVLMRRRRR